MNSGAFGDRRPWETTSGRHARAGPPQGPRGFAREAGSSALWQL